MDGGRVRGLVEVVLAAAAGRAGAERDALVGAVEALAGLRRWLDGVEVELVRSLADVDPAPELAVAGAARATVRQAGGVLERAATAERVAELGSALAAGEVSGGHVDVVTSVLRQAPPEVGAALVEQGSWIARRAQEVTPAQLRRELLAEVTDLEADGGERRLTRQRRASRLRWWIDEAGMWCLAGRYDPETGLVLHQRLAAAAERLHHDPGHLAEHAPADALERQAYLRAHALVALSAGEGRGAGGAEVVVVVDATAPHRSGQPTIDWGLPVELPRSVLDGLYHHPGTRVCPVVVAGGVVVHAPGVLDLGRTTRLASRAQRRVLRGLYPTCALPGCDTRFELCHIHHVTWWEHGGSTDLDNLLPVCNRHHHQIHDRGVELKLTPDRTLTITHPNGTSHTARSPRRE